MVLREGLLGRKDIRRRRESVVSRKSLIARERGKKLKLVGFEFPVSQEGTTSCPYQVLVVVVVVLGIHTIVR